LESRRQSIRDGRESGLACRSIDVNQDLTVSFFNLRVLKAEARPCARLVAERNKEPKAGRVLSKCLWQSGKLIPLFAMDSSLDPIVDDLDALEYALTPLGVGRTPG